MTSPPNDHDDTPTEPDRDAMPCPCCQEGSFMTTTPHGIRTRRCDICEGRRRVSVAMWRSYRETHR